MRKALMEHLGVGEYGLVLSFSMYVYLREYRPQCLIRLAPNFRFVLPPSGIKSKGRWACIVSSVKTIPAACTPHWRGGGYLWGESSETSSTAESAVARIAKTKKNRNGHSHVTVTAVGCDCHIRTAAVFVSCIRQNCCFKKRLFRISESSRNPVRISESSGAAGLRRFDCFLSRFRRVHSFVPGLPIKRVRLTLELVFQTSKRVAVEAIRFCTRLSQK